MPRAIFNRPFNATDVKRGVSIRIRQKPETQLYPEWVIALAESAGAATRQPPTDHSQEET